MNLSDHDWQAYAHCIGKPKEWFYVAELPTKHQSYRERKRAAELVEHWNEVPA